MFTGFLKETNEPIITVKVIQSHRFTSWFQEQSHSTKQWIETTGFIANPMSLCIQPSANHHIEEVFFGINQDLLEISALPRQLPRGNYQLDISATDFNDKNDLFLTVLAWAFAYYQFNRYKTFPKILAKLVLPKHIDSAFIENVVESIFLARDLINTPAAEMMPEQLAEAVKKVAKEQRAKITIINKQKEIEKKFPCLYAVGKGSVHTPCFIDLNWGHSHHPKVTLVGKGICYDTGGLDIKSSDNMLLMKKDMAGAAHALGLAQLIMQEQLPVRLRLLIPAAENAVSGNSYHPGDVIRTSSGLSVEIYNTDAEGRLVLCDALAEASKEKPNQLIDFSTLTGAARVALGPDLPAFFCNHESMAAGIINASQETRDPVWRLPLYQPYRNYLKSPIADLMNASKYPFAGSIVAALYLESFIDKNIPWAHFDLSAWNYTPLPGLEEGAEIKALRAVFEYLNQQYSQQG